MAKSTECKCSCGQSFPDRRARQGHIMSWSLKEPGKHERVDELVYAPTPSTATIPETATLPAPIIHPNGHSDIIAELNLARRAEIEAAENFIPPAGLIAAMELEEKAVVLAVAERLPAVPTTQPAPVMAQPEKEAHHAWPPSAWPPGAYLILIFLSLVGAVVLFVVGRNVGA